MRRLAGFTAVLLVIVFVVVVVNNLFPTEVSEVHQHADILLVLNGQVMNFSRAEFMSDENRSLNPVTHVHDGNGQVIHTHAAGVTLGAFFTSLNMSIDNGCFVDHTGKRFCGGVRFFVNSEEKGNPMGYVIADLDRLLVMTGPGNPGLWLGRISQDACIYSGN